MEITHLAVLYCLALAVVFLSLWLYYDRRDHRLFEAERRTTSFLCTRCESLYTSPGRVEVCRCPKCGFENSRLRF